MYWKEPKKLLGQTACWHKKLQDYNFKIVHIPGKDNGPADALSRMHQDEEREEPKLTSLLPPDAFLNVFEAGDLGTLEHNVVLTQQKYVRVMKQREETISITPSKGLHMTEWRDRGGRLVVPPDNTLKRKILRQLHDHWGTGHPGRDETIRRVQWQYFWPLQRAWIEQYVKRCATCRQNKNLIHTTKTLLYKITISENAPHFMQIALDLITRLPKS
jgi:hypothetical protein